MRATDLEIARRVDQQLILALQQLRILGVARRHTRQHDINHILTNLLLTDARVVLRRDDNGINTHRLVLVVILDSHLTLGIGAQVGHLRALLADMGQCINYGVRHVEREGHVVLRFHRGVTEHHALVARTLRHLRRTAHAHIDVRRLRVNSRQDTTALRLKLILRLGITNLTNGITHHLLDIHIAAARHLTGHYHLTRGNQRLTRHMAASVLRQEIVQHSVTNLVRYFVRVPFADTLGSEKVIHIFQLTIKN